MSINRRGFFQVLGATGLTLAVGKETTAKPKDDQNTEFFGILYDSTRCVGCQSCEFACAEANGLPEPEDSPEPGRLRKNNETRRTVINAHDTSKGLVYVKQQCMHEHKLVLH